MSSMCRTPRSRRAPTPDPGMMCSAPEPSARIRRLRRPVFVAFNIRSSGQCRAIAAATSGVLSRHRSRTMVVAVSISSGRACRARRILSKQARIPHSSSRAGTTTPTARIERGRVRLLIDGTCPGCPCLITFNPTNPVRLRLVTAPRSQTGATSEGGLQDAPGGPSMSTAHRGWRGAWFIRPGRQGSVIVTPCRNPWTPSSSVVTPRAGSCRDPRQRGLGRGGVGGRNIKLRIVAAELVATNSGPGLG